MLSRIRVHTVFISKGVKAMVTLALTKLFVNIKKNIYKKIIIIKLTINKEAL